MKLTIKQIIETSHSDLLVEPRDTSCILTTLDWDSRNVQPGSLFVAIVGEKVNGNDYIIEALEAGAGAIIASEDPSEEMLELARQKGAALLKAHKSDSLASLQAIAHARREGLVSTVIGVTGSSGKTTTKDIIAGVLSGTFKAHATAGNHNSDIGLSETILEAGADDEVIVCEMGMQALGEIDTLAKVAMPHIGVVTNIGVAHCELLGSRENIARAKAELLENLPDYTGVAILPGDDPFTPSMRNFANLDERMVGIVTYGLGEQCDIRATHIEYDEMGHPTFDLWTQDGRCYKAHLNLQGEHNVLNALAAAAVGLRLGVPISEIIAALAEARPAALRQEVITTAEGSVILNDTYNANPDSMRAALALLKRLATDGIRIAVLGDMYELGPEEKAFHRQIGEYAFVNGVDELVTVGELGGEIAAGALAVGMPPCRVHECSDVSEALDALSAIRKASKEKQLATSKCCEVPSIVLVKASRGMELERVVEGLVEQHNDGDAQ